MSNITETLKIPEHYEYHDLHSPSNSCVECNFKCIPNLPNMLNTLRTNNTSTQHYLSSEWGLVRHGNLHASYGAPPSSSNCSHNPMTLKWVYRIPMLQLRALATLKWTPSFSALQPISWSFALIKLTNWAKNPFDNHQYTMYWLILCMNMCRTCKLYSQTEGRSDESIIRSIKFRIKIHTK
jgi:hypothetical protein